MKITAVIPAYNEEKRISDVITEAVPFTDEVLIVDDGSTDSTAENAKKAGATVITNKSNQGYINSVKRGFREARYPLIVTLDADGEHDPRDIPRLTRPIINNEADMVVGRRPGIARLSEKILNFLAHLKVKDTDTGSGMRAIRADLAKKLKIRGKCICGVMDLEAHSLGARIMTEGISIRRISKPRKIAWFHFWQFFYVLKAMIKP